MQYYPKITQQEINTFNSILSTKISNSSFTLIFLSKIKKISQNTKHKIIFIENFENFKTLTKIITKIINSEKKIEIFKLVVEISEKIKFKNCYFYKMLQRKNKCFSDINFWQTLIKDSFITSLNEFTSKILKNKQCEDSNYEEIRRKIKLEKEQDKNKLYLLEFTGYSKSINNYKNLNIQQKKVLEYYFKAVFDNIITQNIIYMTNFNFDIGIITFIVVEFCKMFGVNSETKENYIYLISCYNARNNFYNQKNFNIKETKAKIIILSNVSLFIPKNEIINILKLNKKLNSEGLKSDIFKILLKEENISLNQRIIIWENILQIRSIKSNPKYNSYEKIKKETQEKIPTLQKGTKPFRNNETISMDVARTIFKINNTENQNKLKSLLQCLNLLIPSIGYCQGISYVGGFLLQLLNFDEEKTFYFMLSLETTTKYKNLFDNDLKLLRMFFVVITKIYEINVPEINSHLLENYLPTNLYCSPWFLTLFSCVSTIFDRDNSPKFAITVFERFLLDGWCSIFNAGYSVIDYYYWEILEIEQEMVMNYFITDFSNKNVFKNEYYDGIIKFYEKNKYNINEELIDYLLKICDYEEKYKNREV